MVRKMIAGISTLLGLLFLLFANMIPYKQTWGEEIFVSSDALCVVILMLFASVINGVISFFTIKNQKLKFFPVIMLIIAVICIYQGYMDDLNYVGV